MKNVAAQLVLAILLLGQTTLSIKAQTLPDGWIKAGSKPDAYEMGLTKGMNREGGQCAYIFSKKLRTKGFGTLMQTCEATDYLDQKIRMTGYIKTLNVKGWAGFWLRIDDEKRGKTLAFDNMNDRKITGTCDWKKYEVILDVPPESGSLNFGVLLAKSGKVWFDDLHFEVVASDLPSSGQKRLKRPTNLNFGG